MSHFPVIEREDQFAFEARCRLLRIADLTPTICGYYGRACRCMGDPEGANRALCTGCPLADAASKGEKPVYREVGELTRDELNELKNKLFYGGEDTVSLSAEDTAVIEAADNEDAIPDALVFKLYEGITFVADDFFCNSNEGEDEPHANLNGDFSLKGAENGRV